MHVKVQYVKCLQCNFPTMLFTKTDFTAQNNIRRMSLTRTLQKNGNDVRTSMYVENEPGIGLFSLHNA